MESTWTRGARLGLLTALAFGCDQGGGGAGPADAGTDLRGAEVTAPVDGPSGMEAGPCIDADGDGISDRDEGAPMQDSDMDGMPDYLDRDSDNDGFDDTVESTRRYPGFEARGRVVACGLPADNCDAPPDGLANHRDLDSDNDGLTDAEERMARTNPCADDTDGDGASDLVEVVARSDPTMAGSRPPENTLYVTLPYYGGGARGPHEYRQFTFQTRIRQADVFFLIDNSASMEPVIDNLRRNLGTVIVPGVRAAIPDIRFGVGSFDSMPDMEDGLPGSPGDYTLWVRQRMSADVVAAQRAFDAMRTIYEDTRMMFFGGDPPECEVEAIYEVVAGTGTRTHESDPAALRSVSDGLDPMGNGWVPAMVPARDCPGSERPFGWACFVEGRVPIIVLASDVGWYDGPITGSPASVFGHRYADLVAEMNRRGAFFVGIDVRAGVGGLTYQNAQRLARDTRTLDLMRQPIVFGPGASGIDRASANIVTAITTLAQQTRQDITTTAEPDAMETRLPMGRTTRDFIQAVTPVRGEPDAPAGYDRHDARTFYNVLPSTRVVFSVDFYNDFMEGGGVARVFQATIVVRGRAGSEVDRRPVFIVVPARGGGLPPG